MTIHGRSIIPKIWFRHKSGRFSKRMCDIMDSIFVNKFVFLSAFLVIVLNLVDIEFVAALAISWWCDSTINPICSIGIHIDNRIFLEVSGVTGKISISSFLVRMMTLITLGDLFIMIQNCFNREEPDLWTTVKNDGVQQNHCGSGLSFPIDATTIRLALQWTWDLVLFSFIRFQYITSED